MGRRVVVTGAQGLLGRAIVAELLREDTDPTTVVVGVGRSPLLSGHYTATVTRGREPVRAPLPSALRATFADARYEYHRLDLADAAAVRASLADVAPDAVIHSAAALRDEAWPDLVAANVVATATLVDAVAATVPSSRFVYVSSGSVYGAADAAQLHESAPCRPMDPYATSKYCAEQVVRVACTDAGVEHWIGRVFNLVGPGLQERHLAASLAAQLVDIATGGAPPTLRVGALTTTRDYIDVEDAAAALVRLSRTALPAARSDADAARDAVGVVNVASGREVPVQAVFDGVVAAVDARLGLPTIEIERAPARAHDTSRAYADTARLRALGGAAERPLAASLRAMVDYYVDVVRAG